MHRLQRRDFLYGMGASLGTVALNALLQAEEQSPNPILDKPLAPRDPHFKPRAKACIFLFMEGGPSHIDTFDPKPALEKTASQRIRPRKTKQVSAMASGKRYYI